MFHGVTGLIRVKGLISSVPNLCESFSNRFLAPGTKKATLTLRGVL